MSGIPMETKYRIVVDAELIKNATEELSGILLGQHLAFIERWHASAFAGKFKPILRYMGLGVSLLGLGLCVFVAVFAPSQCPVWLNTKIYVPLFILFALIFFYMPELDDKIRHWTRKNAHKQCKRRAIKCMAKASKLAPYVAEYDIRGDLFTYYRCKADRWKLAWVRSLQGIALQGEFVTVLFKKSKSLHPSIVILHRDADVLSKVLRDLSINTGPIKQYSG